MIDFSKEKMIADEAFAAAARATENYLATYGHRDACGFAWVSLKPATTRMARYLKSQNLAKRNYGESGLMVWNPSGNYTQAMGAKEEGAYAFAKVLCDHGINAYASSRMD
jgi:hypothetical protein